MARPKKELDEELLLKLAQLHCSMTEMADIMGVSKDLLNRRYKSVIAKGKSQTKMKLRRKQIEVAMSGNHTMLIWLGKNMLGQSDSPTLEEDVNILPWSDDIDAIE